MYRQQGTKSATQPKAPQLCAQNKLPHLPVPAQRVALLHFHISSFFFSFFFSHIAYVRLLSSLTHLMTRSPKNVEVTKKHKDAIAPTRMVQNNSAARTTSVKEDNCSDENTCAVWGAEGQDLRRPLIGCGGGVRVAQPTNQGLGFSIWVFGNPAWPNSLASCVLLPCQYTIHGLWLMWQLEKFSWPVQDSLNIHMTGQDVKDAKG